MDPGLLLSAHQLRVERDGRVVVQAADLALRAGEAVSLSGPSGAGKSSLVLSLARLLPSRGGELSFQGVAAAQIQPTEWRRKVCYLPQEPVAFAGTVRDNLLAPFTCRVRAEEKPPSDQACRQGLEQAGLQDVDLKAEAGRLSGGQTARLALLRALLARPSVLLLDEVEAMLDTETAGRVDFLLQAFLDSGGSCLRISHRRGPDAIGRRYWLQDGILQERD
ncbi:MAG: ATP-binding cassette domain-containing protein [Planctomycetota bacterium]|nr:MAG: ATP-binding cassette domain-containing protein [Planctomycetota bacterium]